ETRSMRSKEEANDYRYFPDPDLLPVEITDDDIDRIRRSLPELPEQKRGRYIDSLGLSDYNAELLTGSREIAEYFEQSLLQGPELAHHLANWIVGDLTGALNRSDLEIQDSPVTPGMLSELLQRIADNTISGKIAKQVFEAMWNGEGSADTVITLRGLKQVSDSGALAAMVDEVIANNPAQVEQYLAAAGGKRKKLLGFFVGRIMQASKGQANPKIINELLHQKLV
ncbi:MAG: Asp-tRNA(Asn)/Glu-tRNA(Gln) amidotransferase GatCAB subunit B, partial [Gammaproteobacteria bacterium]|nr:Asp-tRNA(Asn)/Glu-tRNA(Gln) amidotransferase GatCAB subunit B [Gammaproteobacteria bacterium]